jgi:hypothetical protein
LSEDQKRSLLADIVHLNDEIDSQQQALFHSQNWTSFHSKWGVALETSSVCHLCTLPLLHFVSDQRPDSLISLKCGHVFHSRCAQNDSHFWVVCCDEACSHSPSFFQ